MKKGTLIAVGVFAVLLLIVLATRERQVSVGVKKLEVPALEKDKVHQLAIAGAKSALLSHGTSGWTVEDPAKPGAHPADDTQVSSMVDALIETKYGDLVTDRTDRHAELEVDDAKGLRVKVTADGVAPFELVFGKSAAAGTYVRRAGQPEVFLAKGRFGSVGRRDANAWRKHAILALKADEIASLAVRPGVGTGYVLERGADGTWAVGATSSPPPGFRLDSAAAQRAAQQLSTLSAQDFLDAPESDEALGFAGPHDVVEAHLKDGKAVVVSFGRAAASADAGVAAGSEPLPTRVDGDPQIYAVSPYVKNQLLQPMSALRDLSLMAFDVQKVKSLVMRGSKPVTLEKDGAGWKVTTPKTLPAGADFDPAQVSSQLFRIRNMRAARRVESAVPAAQVGLTKDATIEVTLEDGKKQTVHFGKDVTGTPGAKQLYVKGSADDGLYAIFETEKTRFDVGLDLFKKPPPPPQFGNQGGGMKGLEQLPPDVRRQIEAQLRQRAAAPGGAR
jgi:hypothetical protein